MTDDALDLSGSWSGIFSYPRALPPTAFEAELRESLGRLSGESSEAGQTRKSAGQTLHALIDSQRTGFAVTFTKVYDDYHQRPVRYTGTLSEDGTEINGRRDIPGAWAGTFIMIRPGRTGRLVETSISVTV